MIFNRVGGGNGGQTARVLVTAPEGSTVRAYKGNKVIPCHYQTVHTPNPEWRGLPEGYTQVKHIKSHGTEAIDTGIKSKYGLSTKARLKCNNLASDNAVLLGSRGDGESRIYLGYRIYNGTVNIGYKSELSSSASAIVERWIYSEYSLNNNLATIKIDNNIILSSAISPNYSNNYNLYLFAINYLNTTIANQMSCELDYLELYDGDELVRDYVACKKNSNEEYGLFDKVSNTFFGNIGSGAFTGGEEVPQFLTSNVYVGSLDEYGTWDITATKGSDIKTEQLLVDSAIDYYVEINFIHVYGIQRDVTNSNPVYTRTDDAIGFEFSASVGSTAGHSDFDNCMPWSGMVRENIGSDVMVKIPKFWFKRWFDGNIEHIQIADGPATGFSVHPMFMYGATECDRIYVGAYHTASGYVSQTGKAPLVRITRATARTSSNGKGAGWSQLDFSANCGIILLALVETASNDIQATVGRGYCDNNSAAINSGSCDSVPNLTGRPSGTDGKTGVVYRGIENFWGNIWQWVDGININSGTPYICLDPSKYADDTSANYTQLSYSIGSTSYSESYISRIGLDENNPFAILPTQASGRETTYYCDAIWSLAGWRVCTRGGAWPSGGGCGLFTVGVLNLSVDMSLPTGVRLLYRPIGA